MSWNEKPCVRAFEQFYTSCIEFAYKTTEHGVELGLIIAFGGANSLNAASLSASA